MNNDRLDLQSPDIVSDNFEKLAILFPNCVTEGADGKVIDFDLLKQELSYTVVEGNKERYRLEWPGKREAIVTANLPTTKTLRPVREDSVDFDNTENIYIEGDNLEVLKLLQESYLGKIKMIYIDPPYNTGKDFVYKDNFSKDAQDELIESGQKDEYNQRLVVNPEASGRYHSDWLSMMYPRLKLARNLLTQDGVFLVSIGQEEVSNLGRILIEIFGEDNYIALISRVAKTASDAGKFFAPSMDYILCFGKNTNATDKFNEKIKEDLFKKVETTGERKGELYRDDVALYQASLKLERSKNARYYIECPDGSKCIPPEGKRWRIIEESYLKMRNDNKIVFKKTKKSPLIDENGERSNWNLYTKSYLKDREEKGAAPRNFIEHCINRKGADLIKKLEIPFDFSKPIELTEYLLSIIGISDGDIVLDFFSGSASTAHGVMKYNSENTVNIRHIQVQLPEETDEKSEAFKDGYFNICEIGKERIRRAAKKIKEETNADIDYGFRVYRLDSSNMQDVYYKPQDYDQANLDLFGDNVKPDRTADDLLAQVMLDWGLPLSLKIEQADVSGKNVFKVAENSLYACFDNGIDEDFAKEIAKDKPLRIVFKDSGFKNDTAKTNVKQLLKQLSPETEMKVI